MLEIFRSTIFFISQMSKTNVEPVISTLVHVCAKCIYVVLVSLKWAKMGRAVVHVVQIPQDDEIVLYLS